MSCAAMARSSHGLVFSEGVILDLNRMKTMRFDEKNWSAKVGPGTASFDLKREAGKRGYRVHTAEPAALVCANIMTSGLLSTFSTTYGISADNFIDAEFIAKDGSFFSLNDITAPNLFPSRIPFPEHEAFAICVSVSMKLHPVTADEEGILVPFESLEKALDFSRDCATRHIGLAIGILGSEFVSSFLAPTKKRAAEAKDIFAHKLGMPYLVLLIGDRFAIRSVHEMGHPVIDQKLFKILFHGLSALKFREMAGPADGTFGRRTLLLSQARPIRRACRNGAGSFSCATDSGHGSRFKFFF